MLKFWSIFIHEIITLVWRPAYWVGVVGVPLLSLVLYGALNLVKAQTPNSDSLLPFSDLSSMQSLQSLDALKEMVNPLEDTRLPLGIVDLAGVTRLVPEAVNPDDYLPFATQAEAQQALAAGRLRAFYLFPVDFVRSGQVLYFASVLSINRAIALDDSLDYWVRFNLAEGDQLAVDASYTAFMVVNETNLDPLNAPRFNILDPQSLLPVMSVLYFLTFLLLMSSGMIFASFNRESSNRVMEVMLTSTSAERLLWGKFAALALIGILQIILWVCGMAAFGAQIGSSFYVQALQSISPQLIGWMVLFCALSFLLYGTLMLGLATRFPYLREGQMLLYAIMAPLLLPIILLIPFSQTPNHWLLVLFSLFPLTAPTTILIRMMLVDLPLWQPLLSAGLLLASTIYLMRFLARNFRPTHLLSSQKPDWFKRVKRN